MSISQDLSAPEAKTISSSWTKHDTSWMLSLFGTSVGAGILFLPINIGSGGFWSLVIMALLAGPMTFWAHRGLARFVLSSTQKDADFTDVVEEHFGQRYGRLISLLYFLSIFPILLIYGVGLTNTVDSFMVHQLGMAPPSRVLLSGCLVFGMIAVMLAGEKTMLRVFGMIVYPLTFILAGISIYLIPSWHMPNLSLNQSVGDLSASLWLAIPVVVFAFSYTPVVSGFVNAQRRQYGNQAHTKSETILKRTSVMLIAFVLFFVFSCVLSLTPEQLQQAKVDNVSVLSYLANVEDSHFIMILGPLIAFIAITSSFLGHFMGARESFNGLVAKQTSLSIKTIDKIGVVLMFVCIWFAAVINPSILGMMEAFSGPVIAMILFLMPMLAVYHIESLKIYRGKISTYFILLMGCLAVGAIVFNLVK
ncbi:serine/threonine protein kinase [Photobacterium kishitanii]|uniref:HAAAP family serine/threonine permease n=1 Tax=Photobacterium kishitanii TaxID=318456 RepID=A0AAX0YWB6_9GAMM|nr:serine/threonine protein kinase [Photobacterium kishitanii]KJG55097.1 serine/threonine protein kinase [Photobacterium kishitanii]KJG57120.1 serine/threonine protein kinase [Photobacterium kishitanii]KJG64125.1 serine/threonine protein kinase [Photobacterium kishitanii]KJG65658.1 serine/threonine protein kinase [Photobacterium kishitanii]